MKIYKLIETDYGMPEPNLDEIIEMPDSKLAKLIEEAERLRSRKKLTRKEYYEIVRGVGINEETAEKMLQESKEDEYGFTNAHYVDDKTIIDILKKEKVKQNIYTEPLIDNLLMGYKIRVPNNFLEQKYTVGKFIYFFEPVFVKREGKLYKLCRERKRK